MGKFDESIWKQTLDKCDNDKDGTVYFFNLLKRFPMKNL